MDRKHCGYALYSPEYGFVKIYHEGKLFLAATKEVRYLTGIDLAETPQHLGAILHLSEGDKFRPETPDRVYLADKWFKLPYKRAWESAPLSEFKLVKVEITETLPPFIAIQEGGGVSKYNFEILEALEVPVFKPYYTDLEEPEYECLECGQTYKDANKLEQGARLSEYTAMGCARCA